jgi:hypothetical protein
VGTVVLVLGTAVGVAVPQLYHVSHWLTAVVLLSLLVLVLAEGAYRIWRQTANREQELNTAISQREQDLRDLQDTVSKEHRQREVKALREVIDLSHDINFMDNRSFGNYPDYSYSRVEGLRATILKAQGAFPRDSETYRTLETMQNVAGELRQNYRELERPVGEPDRVWVTPEAFKPYVQAFRDSFAPLLEDLENRVLSPLHRIVSSLLSRLHRTKDTHSQRQATPHLDASPAKQPRTADPT